MTSAFDVVTCEICSKQVPRRAPGQRTCGDERCRERARIPSPDRILKMRERNRAWCIEHRGIRRRNVWLAGAPPFAEYLPGAGCVMDVFPRPRWALEHRNVRALHGMLSAILGTGHEERDPAFALVPWTNRFGWAAWFWGDRSFGLAGRRIGARLFDDNVEVRFSPPWRIRPPVLRRRGRQRVRIDAITPVCSQSTDRALLRVAPTAESLRAALTVALPRRLGVAVPEEHVALDLRESATQVGTVLLGSKYGLVRGWVGSVDLEVNAVTRWLLECAQTVGLGGRTAFGFGRIRISSAQ